DATGSTNPVEILMDTEKSVTAVFVELVIPKFTLSKLVSPESSGTITDSGEGSYDVDETATVTAMAGPGFAFDRWEGNASGTENPIEILMDSNKEVTAIFREVFNLTTAASLESSGTVKDSGNGAYLKDSIATVEAIAEGGFGFDHWEGSASGSDNPIEILMDGNKSITAIFHEITSLTTIVSPENSGTINESGDGSYVKDSTATIEAIPALGYLFVSWSTDASGDENPLDLVMNDNKAVTAHFVQDLSDQDNDGLSAYEELAIHGTNPEKKDTDGDKINDGDEVGTIFNPAIDDTPTLQLLASNPGLYLSLVLSSAAVIPEIVIEKNESGDFEIIIQIEKTDDLTNWVAMDLTNAVIEGNKITVVVPGSGSLEFLRSRSSK
ncbi:MAG: hypothetical protein O3C43_20410, partial [Verrucomicrobia bacterium]|nr:hypothetical protein [Verrucomicrobiota bacterium]